MKKIIKLLRPILIFSMRSWWYITRPKTSGVKAVIICDDEILLIKNTYGYNYILPGGGIKKMESPETAVKREVMEEVGIILDKVEPLSPFVTYEEYKQDTVRSFYAEIKSKDHKIDSVEVDIVEWHKLNNLPKVGSVSNRIIQQYRSLVC